MEEDEELDAGSEEEEVEMEAGPALGPVHHVSHGDPPFGVLARRYSSLDLPFLKALPAKLAANQPLQALPPQDLLAVLKELQASQLIAKELGIAARNQAFELADNLNNSIPLTKDLKFSDASIKFDRIEVMDLSAVSDDGVTNRMSLREARERDRKKKKKKRKRSESAEYNEVIEAPAPAAPASGTPEEFWEYMEPYFAFPGTEAMKLIKEEPSDFEFPPLGEHFASNLRDDEGSVSNPKKKRKSNVNSLKQFRPKNDKLAIADKTLRNRVKDISEQLKIPKSFQCHSLMQRIIAALVKVSPSASSISSVKPHYSVKKETTDSLLLNALNPMESMSASPRLNGSSARMKMPVEERLRQELKFLGMNTCLNIDVSKRESREDDAVSTAIRKHNLSLKQHLQQNATFRKLAQEKMDPLLSYTPRLKRLEEAERRFEQMFLKGKGVSKEDLTRAMNELRACEKDLADFKRLYGETATGYICNPNDFAGNPHRTVDPTLVQSSKSSSGPNVGVRPSFVHKSEELR